MLAQRNLPRDGAKLGRADHVAREGGPAADDLVAGVECQLREVVDDPVRAGAGGDLLEADAMPLGERRPEAVGAAVGIAVQLLGPARERLERLREGPERPLVRGQLDHPLEPELTLDLLDRLARLVGDDVPHRRLEERIRDLREAHDTTLIEVFRHQDRVHVAAVDPVLPGA